MKRRDLERALKKAGFWFERHGGSHDLWTDGAVMIAVPRHNEINERLAKAILRQANDG